MIEIRAQVKGLDEVKRVFDRLPREIQNKALRGALLDGAEIVRAAAASMAPKRAFYPPKRVRGQVVMPGRLRKAIMKRARPRPRQGDVTVSVGASKAAYWWHMVEFGHRLVRGSRQGQKRQVGTVAPRPFLRPAWSAKGPAAVQRVFQRLGPRVVAIARSLRRRVAKAGG